jgi:hypothetical protein
MLSRPQAAPFCGLLFLSRKGNEDLFVYLLSFLTLEEASRTRVRSPPPKPPHALQRASSCTSLMWHCEEHVCCR